MELQTEFGNEGFQLDDGFTGQSRIQEVGWFRHWEDAHSDRKVNHFVYVWDHLNLIRGQGEYIKAANNKEFTELIEEFASDMATKTSFSQQNDESSSLDLEAQRDLSQRGQPEPEPTQGNLRTSDLLDAARLVHSG